MYNFQETDLFSNVDLKYVRDKLIRSVNQKEFHNYLQPLTEAPLPIFPPKHNNCCLGSFDFMYPYLKMILYAEAAGFSVWSFFLEKQGKSKKEIIKILEKAGHLLKFEHSKAILPVSVSAWLTIDDFRWHEIDPVYGKNLNYGLVSQYPELIIPLAMFVADIDRFRLINYIEPWYLDACAQQAYSEASIMYPIS